MIVSVECDATFNGELSPRLFTLGDRSIAINDVLDRWFGEDCDYFKVQGQDGHLYILRHDPEVHRWEIWMYRRAGADLSVAEQRLNYRSV